LLFRDFRIEDASNFEKFIRATSRNWVEYREPATPRSQVSGNIYTSTEYPADQHIFLHNENSHCEGWPLKIFFYCLIAPGEAGETPIADCRRIYQRLDPAIRENFSRRKIKYVRNLGDGLGFSWQTVFKTSNRSEVEEYCRKADIGWEWKDENRLRVHYVRPAVIRHPDTGEMSWFNHGTFFHASTLDPKVRELLAKDFGADNLPYNTYYGDGAEIELSTMDALREVYYAETIAFPWQKRDLLMLDNIAAAHGRRPFQGHRKILVGMADEYRWDQASSINSQ
jgi:alpha-ketoglutarate-dependent taurine dioxygenase